VRLTRAFIVLFIILSVACGIGRARAVDELRIAIMQDDKDAAKKFKPLEDYLLKKGFKFTFVTAQNYSNAAYMFKSGAVDAMFSGSGIAGIFMMKGLAEPIVRPLGKDGSSTYHAVILAKKGTPPYTGDASYFKGKKVVFTALASSGEIFYYSVVRDHSISKSNILMMASHGVAIDALSKGAADIAIVKNHVWDKHAKNYPDLMKVGEDREENPDGTLIVSKKTDAEVVAKLAKELTGLKSDKSPDAKAVLDEMGIKGYLTTTAKDFKHTIELLKKAGVDESFDFRF